MVVVLRVQKSSTKQMLFRRRFMLSLERAEHPALVAVQLPEPAAALEVIPPSQPIIQILRPLAFWLLVVAEVAEKAALMQLRASVVVAVELRALERPGQEHRRSREDCLHHLHFHQQSAVRADRAEPDKAALDRSPVERNGVAAVGVDVEMMPRIALVAAAQCTAQVGAGPEGLSRRTEPLSLVGWVAGLGAICNGIVGRMDGAVGRWELPVEQPAVRVVQGLTLARHTPARVAVAAAAVAQPRVALAAQADSRAVAREVAALAALLAAQAVQVALAEYLSSPTSKQ